MRKKHWLILFLSVFLVTSCKVNLDNINEDLNESINQINGNESQGTVTAGSGGFLGLFEFLRDNDNNDDANNILTNQEIPLAAKIRVYQTFIELFFSYGNGFGPAEGNYELPSEPVLQNSFIQNLQNFVPFVYLPDHDIFLNFVVSGELFKTLIACEDESTYLTIYSKDEELFLYILTKEGWVESSQLLDPSLSSSLGPLLAFVDDNFEDSNSCHIASFIENGTSAESSSGTTKGNDGNLLAPSNNL